VASAGAVWRGLQWLGWQLLRASIASLSGLVPPKETSPLFAHVSADADNGPRSSETDERARQAKKPEASC
jgi:hypothetical protein